MARKFNGRTRNYHGVVYPDSAPENWLEILRDDVIVGSVVSPLHHGFKDGVLNHDLKDHYHVILIFSTVKTYEQACVEFDKIGGVMVEPTTCLRSYARYLCHLDSPEKEQFENYMQLVQCFHGTDYAVLIELPEDRLDCIGQMLDFVAQNDVTCFFDLLQYARLNNQEWFRSLTSNSAYIMSAAIKSRSWQLKELEYQKAIIKEQME